MLSRCELVVLAMLSSLQSLDEIAADLIVSVNTVKSHVRSIYSKLGVSSRRSAVLAAHERGLVLCVGADGPGTSPAPVPPAPRLATISEFIRQG
jgi:DNA-binding CsgD family transcriptional regulator